MRCVVRKPQLAVFKGFVREAGGKLEKFSPPLLPLQSHSNSSQVDVQSKMVAAGSEAPDFAAFGGSKRDRYSLNGDLSGGSASGYGHHVIHRCCELVVDPLTVFGLLAFILSGAAFLNVLVTMNIMMRRRKRGTGENFGTVLMDLAGEGREKKEQNLFV